MTIDKPYFYFKVNEWHHLYLGLILIAYGYGLYSSPLSLILGAILAIDDIVQHHLQARLIYTLRQSWLYVTTDSLFVRYSDDGFKWRTQNLNIGLINQIMYNRIGIHKWKWVNNVTAFINGLFR